MTKNVKVILLQDVPHVGQKDDIKSVRFGFVKNWLIPQGLAILATSALLAQLERARALKEEKIQKEAEQYQIVIEKLKSLVLRLRPKKTKKATLYAAIDRGKISEALKKKGIAIDPSSIQLEKPIKSVGEYNIPIAFSKDYQTNIKIVVQ